MSHKHGLLPKSLLQSMVGPPWRVRQGGSQKEEQISAGMKPNLLQLKQLILATARKALNPGHWWLILNTQKGAFTIDAPFSVTGPATFHSTTE